MATNNYYGKYRAKVTDVADPEKRGRIRVMCPKVLGEAKSAWCEPCIPVAYDLGGDYAIPKVDEFVWVEFEEGNSNKPIYTGGLWSTNKSPSHAYVVKNRLITWGDCKIEMNETPNKSIAISIGSSSILMTKTSINIASDLIYLNGNSISSNANSFTHNGKEVACDGDNVTVGGETGTITK